MARIKKSPTLWALAAAAVLVLLQLPPLPGAILMMFGAGMIVVLLLHVALISMFAEAATGRLPRILMIVPVAVYGAYYVAYWQEGRDIAERAAALRKINPGKVFDFDPAIHSLVGKDQGNVVQTHDIPVVYEPNPNFKPQDYLSYRLLRRDQCDAIKRDTQSRIIITYVPASRGVCVLRFPDNPEHRIVTVSSTDPEIWKRKPGVTEFVTEIVADGNVVGSYRSAVAWRLPIFPFGFIGCGLVSSKPAWECGAAFARKFQTLDTSPVGIDRKRYDTPESIMLGLRKYTPDDLASFKGFPQNQAILTEIAGEPQRVENDAFRVLDEILNGQEPETPWAMAYTLSRDPRRLEPLAGRMAARFVGLYGKATRDSTLSVLQSGLVSLPPQEFKPVAMSLFEIVRSDHPQDDYYAIWRRYPALYLRAADAGPETFAFYKQEFLSGRMNRGYLRKLPVLAICRIGSADAETIAELQRRYLSQASEYSEGDYKAALFVTLKKLGQDSFLRENEGELGWRDRAWGKAVMDGKGDTETGPNNCMGKEWGSTAFLGPYMEPALTRVRDGWDKRVVN